MSPFALQALKTSSYWRSRHPWKGRRRWRWDRSALGTVLEASIRFVTLPAVDETKSFCMCESDYESIDFINWFTGICAAPRSNCYPCRRRRRSLKRNWTWIWSLLHWLMFLEHIVWRFDVPTKLLLRTLLSEASPGTIYIHIYIYLCIYIYIYTHIMWGQEVRKFFGMFQPGFSSWGQFRPRGGGWGCRDPRNSPGVPAGGTGQPSARAGFPQGQIGANFDSKKPDQCARVVSFQSLGYPYSKMVILQRILPSRDVWPEICAKSNRESHPALWIDWVCFFGAQ